MCRSTSRFSLRYALTFLLLLEFYQTSSKASIETYVRNPPALHALEDLEEIIYNFLKRLQLEIRESKTSDFFLNVINSEVMSRRLDFYIQDYEASTIKLKTEYKPTRHLINGSYRVAWNPLATFKMVSRVKSLQEFPKLLESLNETRGVVKEGLARINDFMQERNMTYPTEEDYENVMEGILKIHSIYHLKAKDMAQGNIFGVSTHVKLSGEECLALGKYESSFSHVPSLDWIQVAIEFLIAEGASKKQLEIAKDMLAKGIREHNKDWRPNLSSFNEIIQGNSTEKLQPVRDILFEAYKNARKQGLNMLNRFAFEALCMGGNSQTLQEQSELFCWYETKRTPYLRINPAKVELLSKAPLVLHYHNLIGDSVIRYLIETAANDLQPSVVVINDPTNTRLVSHERTSYSSPIYDDSPYETTLLRNHMIAVTGFRLHDPMDADYLSIVGYTFGSYYNFHTDATESPTGTATGDRIATVLVYLNDVEKGGGTAFIQAGIVVQPIKGSAVFWYNIDASGETDDRSWHGACPVILGEKWVANKWVRVNSQFRSHRCLQGSAGYPFYVNGKLLAVKTPWV